MGRSQFAHCSSASVPLAWRTASRSSLSAASTMAHGGPERLWTAWLARESASAPSRRATQGRQPSTPVNVSHHTTNSREFRGETGWPPPQRVRLDMIAVATQVASSSLMNTEALSALVPHLHITRKMVRRRTRRCRSSPSSSSVALASTPCSRRKMAMRVAAFARACNGLPCNAPGTGQATSAVASAPASPPDNHCVDAAKCVCLAATWNNAHMMAGQVSSVGVARVSRRASDEAISRPWSNASGSTPLTRAQLETERATRSGTPWLWKATATLRFQLPSTSDQPSRTALQP
mmetsp:Transcript_54171/g.127966  ORF Transcript_54171/g.127966 Transcript_54171/m.127966 type:complete len:292 (+) Transcript_54171:197-1072(+)